MNTIKTRGMTLVSVNNYDDLVALTRHFGRAGTLFTVNDKTLWLWTVKSEDQLFEKVLLDAPIDLRFYINELRRDLTFRAFDYCTIAFPADRVPSDIEFAMSTEHDYICEIDGDTGMAYITASRSDWTKVLSKKNADEFFECDIEDIQALQQELEMFYDGKPIC